MDIKQMQGDVASQEEGVWLQYAEGDWKFKLAYGGTGSRAGDIYDRLLSKARQRNRNTLWLPSEVTTPIQRDWLAAHIFKGWKNVTSDGKPLAFNKENLEALLNVESIGARVVEWAGIECRMIENFKNQTDADVGSEEGSPATAAMKSGSSLEP